MADDMGFSDLGCYGSSIETPNIDQLAEDGVRFTQFYNCARCCPTRASLLTGQYPHRVGVGEMINRKRKKKPPAYQGYLNDRCLTIAEALKSAGYHTLMSGKWHVGEYYPNWPLQRGFERYYGLVSGASSYFDTSFVEPKSDKVRIMLRDDQEIVEKGEGFFMTDAITDNAVRMIEEWHQYEDPFFLYVAYTAPHWPLHALPEDIRKYEDHFRDGWDSMRKRRYERVIEMGLVNEKWKLPERDDRVPPWESAEHMEWEIMKMAVYAAQVDRMDQGVGRILRALMRPNIEGNTLVIFLSDNGGCDEILRGNDQAVTPGGSESYMSYGVGWANASNTPFRRYKSWMHEGGISTPFIARWPGVIAPASLTHQVGHVIDLMPTCLDVAGVIYPDQYRNHVLNPLDGRSLLPVLRGEAREEHAFLCWEHFGKSAVREDKWKLVMDSDLNEYELYDMEEDRTETHNLADEYPERVEEMGKVWKAWAEAVGVYPKKVSE
ncbi:MAG: arylsulfatase [Gemmatimonadota bacterium]|nr:MAG: arylsulfatase [Gemmatimonadota bacterium]